MQQLEKAFERIGARAKVIPYSERVLEFHLSTHHRRVRRFPNSSRLTINIRNDRRGEFYEIREGPKDFPQVIDIRQDLRHLVLMVKGDKDKSKYLCGHDERHWFVAAVPGISTRDVRTAMEALRPTQATAPGTIRSGEWFLIPHPNLDFSKEVIYEDEPIQRGRSKPHWCEELIRSGGTTVYVHSLYAPNSVGQAEYARISGIDSHHRSGWRTMTRDAKVYIRGTLRHPDHYTVHLGNVWHEVVMNLEDKAPHADRVAFLD
jgi:hypothetical protein